MFNWIMIFICLCGAVGQADAYSVVWLAVGGFFIYRMYAKIMRKVKQEAKLDKEIELLDKQLKN